MSEEVTCPDCEELIPLPDCPWGADVYCPDCKVWYELDSDCSCSEDGDESHWFWINGRAEDQTQKVEAMK